MGRVYSTAKRVIVWLGEALPAQSMAASRSIKCIAEEWRRSRRESDLDETNLNPDDTWQPPVINLDKEALESLELLYAETWFSRVWCIQEIRLAVDAVMLWGDHDLSWLDVGSTALWLESLHPRRALEFDENAFYATIPTSNAYNMFTLGASQYDLFALVHFCEIFNASDPRDRVYGLLSLLDSADEAEAVCVDYGKETGEVYADAVLALIRLYKKLYPFKYVEHHSEYNPNKAFTSWTPQWGQLDRPRTLLAAESELSACADTTVERRDISRLNSQYLRLCGLFYSEITHIYLEMDLDNMKPSRDHPFLAIGRAVIDSSADDGKQYQILARTLTAGCDGDHNDIVSATETQKATFYSSFLGFLNLLVIGDHYENNSRSITTTMDFFAEAETVCAGRRFFLTKKGTFGLGPACMRAGDIVVVLFGGETPYILRPQGDAYHFMGQAYVDELMQGELIVKMKAGEIQEQEFCLV
ncbi:hypothetical protein GQ44DRAFT_706309 [Phaeosphaeriaceae sp. PMI808]|nr:hypothetical protein GQ44DRAFT_706309 [Phaeosphaeriaceae sp. PMI808]